MRYYLLLIFLFVSCKNDIKRPPLASLFFNTAIGTSGSERIGVVTTDFGAAGRFNVLNPDAFFSLQTPTNIHSDAVAKSYDGKVIIINRLNRDSILTLNPSIGFLPEQEYSTGKGTNPQDIIKVSDNKAYISLYNNSNLLVVSPSGGVITKYINLTQYAEPTSSGAAGPDGNPEMSYMFLDGNSLYVQLQRLDRNDPSGIPTPTSTALLLEIDINTDSVIGTYTFFSKNPLCPPQKIEIGGIPHMVTCAPGKIGFQSALDGGIVAFNLVSKTFVNKFLYAETTGGGDILDMQIKNETEGYVYVLDSAFNKSIQEFNPTTGEKVRTLSSFSASAGNISGLLLSGSGKLYAGDASFSRPGVLIFDTKREDRAKITSQSIDVGLRPFDIIEIK